MNAIVIEGKRFNEPVFLYLGDAKKELKDWYAVDFNGRDAGFAWGYRGEGPHRLSYSILRELFGRKAAEQEYESFCRAFISSLHQERAFRISSAEIMHILGIDNDGVPSGNEAAPELSMEERGSIAARHAMAGQGGRKEPNMQKGRQSLLKKIAALTGLQ